MARKSYLGRPEAPRGPSRRQERRFAAAVGGTVVPGSGSSPNARGDVRFRVGKHAALGELKWTCRRSYTLTRRELEKIRTEAREADRVPVFVIEFRDATERPGDAWVVLPWTVLRELLDGAA